MTNAKIDETVTVALEAIGDAHPNLLTMTELAQAVASGTGVSVSTARKRLRTAVEEGRVLELAPYSRKFFIDLPGEDKAGVGPFYIAMEYTNSFPRTRHRFITTDDSKMRPSSYGPGNTTYVADPAQIAAYIKQLADEKKAKEDAEREAYRKDKAAQKEEIKRRFPGLTNSLRRLTFLGDNVPSFDTDSAMLSARAYLDTHRSQPKDAPVTERVANAAIHVEGDANMALLLDILKAGIAAYIEKQPAIPCKHCKGWILHSLYGSEGHWWHVATTTAACGKNADTTAEPAEVGE